MAASDEQPEPREAPPPGVRTMAIVRWVLVAVAAAVAVGAWSAWARDGAEGDSSSAGAQKYTCPMHPQVVSDRPGECPICHMDLVPIESAAPSKPAPAPTAKAAGAPPGSYTCPMHPEVVSNEPGRCPKCRMPLEQVAADGGAAGDAPAPPGTTPIELSLDRIQSIGVRVSRAEERDAASTLRVTAVVEAPEQTAAEVHVRSPGFVEHVAVKETGIRVRRGQALVSIYSPEVYQAQADLLAAKGFGDAGTRSIAAAKNRLSLLGFGSRAADKVLERGKPSRTYAVSAPISGFVTKKNVVLGSYVGPETALYEIVDLSKVYVVAQVFQSDLADVRVGTEGRFIPEGQAQAATDAKVDLVYPEVNVAARTTRVRLQIANPERELLPGQYGRVEFRRAAKKAVVVPRDAVIDTGTASYVFIAEDGGRFVPRTVRVGGEDGDDVVVLEGVRRGERVVSRATFLIDSESRLRASLAPAAEP